MGQVKDIEAIYPIVHTINFLNYLTDFNQICYWGNVGLKLPQNAMETEQNIFH
jgi:hypothetical protein